MTAKEYLSQSFLLHKKLIYLERELERYDLMMKSIPQSQFEQERVTKNSSVQTPNIIAVEKYYETKVKINEIKIKIHEVEDMIIKSIENLENDDFKILLKYRYIDHLNYTDIENKLYVSYSTIKRWHSEAIKQINVRVH